jgi:hypothetical protein
MESNNEIGIRKSKNSLKYKGIPIKTTKKLTRLPTFF